MDGIQYRNGSAIKHFLSASAAISYAARNEIGDYKLREVTKNEIVNVALEDRLGDIGEWIASLTGVGWFRSLGESATIVTGLIFIACVLAFRRGIVGEMVARVKPLRAS